MAALCQVYHEVTDEQWSLSLSLFFLLRFLRKIGLRTPKHYYFPFSRSSFRSNSEAIQGDRNKNRED